MLEAHSLSFRTEREELTWRTSDCSMDGDGPCSLEGWGSAAKASKQPTDMRVVEQLVWLCEPWANILS